MKKKRQFLALILALAPGLWAQDDSLRFRTLLSKGIVTAYHDENDETSHLYFSQMVDDGDKITTGKDSEALLELKGLATIYLAPRTRVLIEKLRPGERGPQCFLRLITGRVFFRLERPFPGILEIRAGSVRSHEHGTLFEVERKGEKLTLVSYEGSLVVDYHGKSKIAKTREVIRMDNGKFRNRSHHLDREEEQDLQDFQRLLEHVKSLSATPAPARP